MSIYNKKTIPDSWIWETAELEYGKPLECVVDVHAMDVPERKAWLDGHGINYYFVASYLFFFETEADGIQYHLVWADQDHFA